MPMMTAILFASMAPSSMSFAARYAKKLHSLRASLFHSKFRARSPRPKSQSSLIGVNCAVKTINAVVFAALTSSLR